MDKKRANQFWRYVSFQMRWRFVIGGMAGFYSVLLGLAGTFVIHKIKAVDMTCEKGAFSYYWKPGSTLADLFITLHLIIIFMQATFFYIVFFFIPYKFNRIKKTPKEVKNNC